MNKEKDYIREMEINGVKFEVDMRTLKRIDTFKVGDNVKILDKEYGSDKIKNGVIVEFLNFKDNPTIQVACFNDNPYSSKDIIEFININKNTKDYEIIPSSEHELSLTKTRFMDLMNSEIERVTEKLNDLVRKKEWFIKNYEKHFKTDENDKE